VMMSSHHDSSRRYRDCLGDVGPPSPWSTVHLECHFLSLALSGVRSATLPVCSQRHPGRIQFYVSESAGLMDRREEGHRAIAGRYFTYAGYAAAAALLLIAGLVAWKTVLDVSPAYEDIWGRTCASVLQCPG
jgi:hypothetical protein